MRSLWFLCVLVSVTAGCNTQPAPSSLNDSQRASDSARVQAAIDAAMVEARAALTADGVTKSGLTRCEQSLARLASTPGLLDIGGSHPIHGNPRTGIRKLAGNDPDGISLYLTHLEPGVATPVHDHTTWGVIHIIRGHDHYVRWERADDDSDSHEAVLGVVEEHVLGPGQSLHWFPPPRDIHSQAAEGSGVLWELVMTGRDLTNATASGHRHWYDLKTGAISHDPPH